MSVLFTDIIADAKAESDFDGVGAGASLNLTDSRWTIWGNLSLESLYKKFLIWNPDLFEKSVDVTLSAQEGTITPTALASDYRTFKGLTKNPDTHTRSTVHRFNDGARDQQCEVHYRARGTQIALEPKERSNGTYRLYYTAGPVNLSTGDSPAAGAVTDATAKAMIDNTYPPLLYGGPGVLQQTISNISAKAAGVLPGAWTASGAGIGKTLAATVNGAMAPVDGVTIGSSNFVLVHKPAAGGGVNPQDYGLYRVVSAGNVSTPAILARWVLYDEPTEITFGSKIYVSFGATYAGHVLVMNVAGPIVVDTTPLNFVDTGAVSVVIDNVNIVPGDKVFINTGGNDAADGLFDVSVFAGFTDTFLNFTRSAGQVEGTSHPAGYTVAVTQGLVNGNKIYVADGNIVWSVSAPTWSKAQSAIDPLYEPAREWLAVRIAMRALGKEESNTGTLGTRLAELTAEMQAYVQSLDSGDGDTVVDVEQDCPPGIYRLLR